MKIDYKWGVIALLTIIIILSLQKCGGSGSITKKPKKVSITHIWHTDTIKHTNLVPYYVVDSFPIYIDTNQVVPDYYAMRTYIDTCKIDSSGYVSVKSEVYMNKLFSQMYYPKIKTTTYIIEQVPVKDRVKLYVGAEIGRSPVEFGFAPSLMLTGKKSAAYSLKYDIVNKNIYLGVYVKIGFRRDAK